MTGGEAENTLDEWKTHLNGPQVPVPLPRPLG